MKTSWIALSLGLGVFGVAAGAAAAPFPIVCAQLNQENIALGNADASGYTKSSVLSGVSAGGHYNQPTAHQSIQLPPNGIICLKSFTGQSSSYYTLAFTRNAANTPVTILVEDAAILNYAVISVSGEASLQYYGVGVNHLGGKGGNGGSDGGSCDFSITSSKRAGEGVGPGGGKGSITGAGGGGAGPTRAGGTGFGAGGAAGGAAPSAFDHRHLHGGSGGGCGTVDGTIGSAPSAGGGGGGVLVVAAGQRIDTGVNSNAGFRAMGGSATGGYGGGGGGGVVRLVSPIIEGNGLIDVRGTAGLSCGITSARSGCGGNGLLKLEGINVAGSFLNTALSTNGEDSIKYGTPQDAVLPTAQLPTVQVLNVAATFDGTVQNQIPAAPTYGSNVYVKPSVYLRPQQVLTVTVRTTHIPDSAAVMVRMNAVNPTPGAGGGNVVVQAINPTGTGTQRDWTATLTVPTDAKIGSVEAWVQSVCTPGTSGCPAVE